jgi:hypothetical protein
MLHRTKSTRARPASNSRFGEQIINNHLALALVGQTVSLLDHAHKIAHGVVAGVVTETGRSKLIVDRVEYDLNQVLSVTPAAFN